MLAAALDQEALDAPPRRGLADVEVALRVDAHAVRAQELAQQRLREDVQQLFLRGGFHIDHLACEPLASEGRTEVGGPGLRREEAGKAEGAEPAAEGLD